MAFDVHVLTGRICERARALTAWNEPIARRGHSFLGIRCAAANRSARADFAGTPIAESAAAMSFKPFRIRLLGALRALAQPASAQVSYLARLGLDGSADELRVQYEEAIADAGPFVGSGLSTAQAKTLQALTAQLCAMAVAGKAHLWNERSLQRSVEWAQVRELAAEALVGLDAWPRSWGKGRRRLIRASAEAARRAQQDR